MMTRDEEDAHYRLGMWFCLLMILFGIELAVEAFLHPSGQIVAMVVAGILGSVGMTLYEARAVSGIALERFTEQLKAEAQGAKPDGQ